MRARPWHLALLAIAIGFLISAVRTQLGDYNDDAGDNNAAPTIAALARGDWTAAADAMPAQGMTSIVLRVPFVALAGGDKLWAYRLGAFACVLLLVALLLVLDRRMARDSRPTGYRVAMWAVILLGPIALAPLHSGHPEEIVGGVLCVGAVLAAIDRRVLWAGVLLGLAVGTKQWALLAVPVVLVAVGGPRVLDRRRLIAAGLAALVAAATVLPGILANPARYRLTTGHLAETVRTYPQTLWWPVATSQARELDLGNGDSQRLVVYSLPGGIQRGDATGIAVIVAFLVGAVGLARGRLRDPMATLAYLMMLRCVLDPMNLTYYATPALLAIAAWEASALAPRRGLPIATLLTSTVIWGAWRWPTDTAPALVFAVWLLSLPPLLLLRRRADPPATDRPTTEPRPAEAATA